MALWRLPLIRKAKTLPQSMVLNSVGDKFSVPCFSFLALEFIVRILEWRKKLLHYSSTWYYKFNKQVMFPQKRFIKVPLNVQTRYLIDSILFKQSCLFFVFFSERENLCNAKIIWISHNYLTLVVFELIVFPIWWFKLSTEYLFTKSLFLLIAPPF